MVSGLTPRTIKEIILKRFVTRIPVQADLKEGEVAFDKQSLLPYDYNLLIGTNPGETRSFFWQPKRRIINDNLNLYVSPTGDVNGDGTINAPFDSLRTALFWVRYHIDTCKFKVVINLLPGTHLGFVVEHLENIVIQGDPANANAAVIDIQTNGALFGIGAYYCKNVTFKHLRLTGTNKVTSAIRAINSSVTVENVIVNAGVKTAGTSDLGSHIYSGENSFVDVISLSILGATFSPLYAIRGGNIRLRAASVANNPNFTYFAVASRNSHIEIETLVTGTATGSRCYVEDFAGLKGQANIPAGMIGTVVNAPSGGFVN